MSGFDALASFPVQCVPVLVEHASALDWGWRALHHHDLPWLAALYASTREEELAAVPWPAASRQQFLRQQFDAQHRHYLAAYPGAHYLAIEQAGQPVGRLYLDRCGVDDLIVDISLLPRSRGAGLGSAVIGQLQAAAAARQRGLALHVARCNPAARRLYQRLGFIAAPADLAQTHVPMRWCAAVTAEGSALS
ncbi:GNAT family N-acetyltransferase [Stenotrophomonas sp. C3(2023)]|uniref:GNAT family N-acetyltransferase n=1 Tax=Stenotrophomonas sp. C3(2023) TaxID=3080277 RepID=UPI00293C7574|nr:GNAT family N-acetyltransferase [Stenotrophomonas sp. C3(2023)]MDV3467147.1 GNAT family N-acetyltransferase [Stenotrophomonas sp. C3(2023)]